MGLYRVTMEMIQKHTETFTVEAEDEAAAKAIGEAGPFMDGEHVERCGGGEPELTDWDVLSVKEATQ